MIEIFRGNEIENLQLRRRYECQKCFKDGYSSDHSIQCHFCNSNNVRLIWISFRDLFTHRIHWTYFWHKDFESKSYLRRRFYDKWVNPTLNFNNNTLVITCHFIQYSILIFKMSVSSRIYSVIIFQWQCFMVLIWWVRIWKVIFFLVSVWKLEQSLQT